MLAKLTNFPCTFSNFINICKSDGTIYKNLQILIQANLIKKIPSIQYKKYELTELGKEVLKQIDFYM